MNPETAKMARINAMRYYVNKLKCEAIKDFAKRLKETIHEYDNRVDVDGIVLLTRIDNSIDNLVKEIVEKSELSGL